MPATIKHQTLTADTPDDTIRTTHWDEDHELVGTPDTLLGFNGAGEAIDVDPAGFAAADLSNVSQADARAKVGTGTMAYRNVTISTAEPSGGNDGDIWFQVEA